MSRTPPLRLGRLADLDRAQNVDKARRDRLEALAIATMRRRYTRARIVLGGALIAELRDAPDDALARRLVDIVNARVWRARDRADILSQLGFLAPDVRAELDGSPDDPSAPVAGRASRSPASVAVGPTNLPDFDALVASAFERQSRP